MIVYFGVNELVQYPPGFQVILSLSFAKIVLIYKDMIVRRINRSFICDHFIDLEFKKRYKQRNHVCDRHGFAEVRSNAAIWSL